MKRGIWLGVLAVFLIFGIVYFANAELTEFSPKIVQKESGINMVDTSKGSVKQDSCFEAVEILRNSELNFRLSSRDIAQLESDLPGCFDDNGKILEENLRNYLDRPPIDVEGCAPSNADVVSNGQIDIFDLLLVLQNWNTGKTGAEVAEPLNVVDIFDLLGLLNSWGQRTCGENKVFVALKNGKNELRVLTWDGENSIFTESVIADMEDHVEAIDIDDADNDGINELVASVESFVFNNTLNLFELNSLGEWERIIVDGDLEHHAEDIEVGDVDNDGLNEIVVGLEHISGIPFNHSPVVVYDFIEDRWERTNISELSEDFVIQDVDLGDIDSDGYSEIVVLRNNADDIFNENHQVVGFNSPLETGSGWERFNITDIKTNLEDKEAERLKIGNIDDDLDLEIIYNSYLGPGSPIGVLRVLDYNGNDWDEFFVAEDTGIIDGLDVLDIDSNGMDEVIAGERPLGSVREFVLYSYTSSQTYSSKILNISTTDIRDAGFGDYDGDGEVEVMGAFGENLIYMDDISGNVTTSTYWFGITVDSTQVGRIP